MRKISRRQLLKMGAGAAVAMGAPRILSGCDSDEQDKQPSLDGGTQGAIEGGVDSGAVDSRATDAASRVAAVRGSDLYAMTREVLDALGGIGKVVEEGETVFLKPNMIGLPWGASTNSFITGECTKPEILVEVAEQCLKVGASEVIIGDAFHRPSFSWAYARTLDESTDLKAEAERLGSEYGKKVTLACLDTDSPEMVEIPSRTYLEKIAVSSLVVDADKVISLPVMKTHAMAQLTLSLKNFLGVTALERYASELGDFGADGPLLWRMDTFDHSSPETIAAIYLDIVDAIRPDLAIIDASIGMEGNGPSTTFGGVTVDMKDRLGSWLLLASTDLVAADATAARIMSHDASDIKQLAMASEMGLGNMQEDVIELVGEKLDDLTVEWEPATLTPGPKPPEAT